MADGRRQKGMSPAAASLEELPAAAEQDDQRGGRDDGLDGSWLVEARPSPAVRWGGRGPGGAV